MARLSARLAVRGWLGLALGALTTGCVLTQQGGPLADQAPVGSQGQAPRATTAPPGPKSSAQPVCQVVAFWHPGVRYVADIAHGAQSAPGLAGRVYLFGPELGDTLVGDGSLSAALYDESDGGSKQLEVWTIDVQTLRVLLRKDCMGWGYTVFLPWASYRPDVSRARIKVCYHGPSRYRLTDRSLGSLREKNVPDGVLEKLKALKVRDLDQAAFEKALARSLAEDERQRFQVLILNHAQVPSDRRIYTENVITLAPGNGVVQGSVTRTPITAQQLPAQPRR
jgi:hypothetical protein